MKLISKPRNSCLFFHRWKHVITHGITVYKECSKCNTRVVTQPSKEFYPVDLDWACHFVIDRLPKEQTKEEI